MSDPLLYFFASCLADVFIQFHGGCAMSSICASGFSECVGDTCIRKSTHSCYDLEEFDPTVKL